MTHSFTSPHRLTIFQTFIVLLQYTAKLISRCEAKTNSRVYSSCCLAESAAIINHASGKGPLRHWDEAERILRWLQQEAFSGITSHCLVLWCVCFLGGDSFLLFVLLVCWLVFPFSSGEMHTYVILSMTVTIVTMKVRLGRIVSPDLRCHFVVSNYSYDYIATSIVLSTRTNALSVCGISKPPWHFSNGRIRCH